MSENIMNESKDETSLDQPHIAHRFGMVAIVGRPNVGKSTLLNAMVGEHLSITSKKPQTTRHRILGVHTAPDYQIAFVDTPGFQTRHTGALNRVMNRTVTQAISGVEAAVFVVEAGKWTPADAQVAALLPADLPKIVVMNKSDLAGDVVKLMPFAQKIAALVPALAYIPVSAEKNRQVEDVIAQLVKLLPEEPAQYAEDDMTDRSERFLAAERIREKVFRLVGDEIPFGTAVEIEQWEDTPTLKKIYAAVVVEREGHKGIILGDGGLRMRRISSEARQDLEKLFDCKIYLEVWIKVRGGWRDNEAALRSLGYE